jgi:molybdopterin converting factor small subunit
MFRGTAFAAETLVRGMNSGERPEGGDRGVRGDGGGPRADGGGELVSGRSESGGSDAEPATDAGPDATTTVDVKCTGHVQEEVGELSFEYTFAGDTLREFLAAFFDEHDVEDMLIAETEAEATTKGWAPDDVGLPGENWAKNPEGEQTRAFARVTVNGQFNEHLEGLDTPLADGDRVALIYPFVFCL